MFRTCETSGFALYHISYDIQVTLILGGNALFPVWLLKLKTMRVTASFCRFQKRSSKKHRAPEPPTDTPNTLFACDYWYTAPARCVVLTDLRLCRVQRPRASDWIACRQLVSRGVGNLELCSAIYRLFARDWHGVNLAMETHGYK